LAPTIQAALAEAAEQSGGNKIAGNAQRESDGAWSSEPTADSDVRGARHRAPP